MLWKRKLGSSEWQLFDLDKSYVESWESSFDAALWKRKQVLHLFVQHTSQADGEGLTSIPPQAITVLEWKPTVSK